MGVSFAACEEALDAAVADLFDADPQVQAVGIARHGSGFGFKAVKNVAQVVASSGSNRVRRTPRTVRKVPVEIDEVDQDVETHLVTPHPLVASLVPEQRTVRPLVCGLQIENVDDDIRQRKSGALGANLLIVGTLGCFVQTGSGAAAILSNNHVLAGENRGVKLKDRILQSGDLGYNSAQWVATLTDFVPIQPSPTTARPAQGNVHYNAVDAAYAQLAPNVAFSQNYLPARKLPGPHGLAVPKVGMKVFKVGRTTGLTRGTITAVNTVVGPIGYAPGPACFNGQVEIVGDNGSLFSDHGDSGSAILSTTGEVVALLFAGNGTQTYASPIQAVLSALRCTLA